MRDWTPDRHLGVRRGTPDTGRPPSATGITQRLEARITAAERRGKATAFAVYQPDREALHASEEHGGAGARYLGPAVYGGLDGIITTFAVVSGVAGANLGADVVLVLGLANLLADGFSMATGAYLSAKSDREYYEREWQHEAWEVDHFPEGERTELYEIYRAEGYSADEAGRLVEIQTRERRRWVEAMMLGELHLLPEHNKPFLIGATTFAAFVVAGAVPLLVFLLGLVVPIASGLTFPVAVALSGAALFVLGAAKVRITQRRAWRSGLEMLAVGGLAALVAYVVGALLQGIGI